MAGDLRFGIQAGPGVVEVDVSCAIEPAVFLAPQCVEVPSARLARIARSHSAYDRAHRTAGGLMNRREFLAGSAAALTLPLTRLSAAAAERRFLYIAEPGIRNYVRYGGVGVLVYDIDNGYTFVRRIRTWDVPAGQEPDNVKGVAASAKTGRLYVTTTKRLLCIDLTTDKIVWDKTPDAGCDRLAISPDGKTMYVPSFEGPHWNVIDAMSGETIAKVELKNHSHNTIFGPDGRAVYLEGLLSPYLFT